jgi:DNA-binding NarL/FixJ family response regulator
MIDGNLIQDEGTLLEAILHRFPAIRVMAKKEAKCAEQLRQRNVMAIVPRNANPERFSAVLDSVSRGMVCFPGEWVREPTSPQALLSLSERQREVLKLLAAGSRIKRLAAI